MDSVVVAFNNAGATSTAAADNSLTGNIVAATTVLHTGDSNNAAASRDYTVAFNNAVVVFNNAGAGAAVDNALPLADNSAAVDNAGASDNVVVTTFPPSKFNDIINKLKYALPVLIILSPIWLLGGFSAWGAGSPVGLNVC